MSRRFWEKSHATKELRPAGVARSKTGLLSRLESDVLVGRGPRVAADQPYGRLAHPRPDAGEPGQLPDRRGDHPLVYELLDLVQQRFTLGVVEFHRLLLKQRVDFGIAAVGIGAALDGKGFEARGSVAEGGAAAHDQVFVFLFRIALEKCGALDRPQIGPDAGLAQVVDDGLADIRESRIAVKRAGVDAFGMPGSSQ